MRVAIHQPQFLPWLGYLDKIDRADLFVVLDTVQFKKNEWQNRNRLRTPQGWQWITVPVLHNFGQPINQVRINQTVEWRDKHIRAVQMHYSRAPYLERFWGGLRTIYERSWEKLTDLNLSVIRWLLDSFGITTPVRLASEMELREEPTQRLVDICRTVGATHYLAGDGAVAYMDMTEFQSSGVHLETQLFNHPVYAQCYEPFMPGMAAVDALFTCGTDALRLLRNARQGRD
jgi:hypothetical protein